MRIRTYLSKRLARCGLCRGKIYKEDLKTEIDIRGRTERVHTGCIKYYLDKEQPNV